MSIANSKSEVARLRERIETELEAMQRGLHGLAFGVARHDFIGARLEKVGRYHADLAQHVGDEEASEVLYTLYSDIVDA